MNKSEMIAIRSEQRQGVIKPSGDSEKISQDVGRFLQSGGVIQHVANGQSAICHTIKLTKQENQDRERSRLGRLFNPLNKK